MVCFPVNLKLSVFDIWSKWDAMVSNWIRILFHSRSTSVTADMNLLIIPYIPSLNSYPSSIPDIRKSWLNGVLLFCLQHQLLNKFRIFLYSSLQFLRKHLVCADLGNKTTSSKKAQVFSSLPFLHTLRSAYQEWIGSSVDTLYMSFSNM